MSNVVWISLKKESELGFDLSTKESTKAVYINCDEMSAWLGEFDTKEDLEEIISSENIINSIEETLSEYEQECIMSVLEYNDFEYQLGYYPCVGTRKALREEDLPPKYTELLSKLRIEGIDNSYLKELYPLKDIISDIYMYESNYSAMFINIKKLSNEAKLNLLDEIAEAYFNTDIDKSVFAEEYMDVVTNIITGGIPVKLNCLSVEEIYTNIVDTILFFNE